MREDMYQKTRAIVNSARQPLINKLMTLAVKLKGLERRNKILVNALESIREHHLQHVNEHCWDTVIIAETALKAAKE